MTDYEAALKAAQRRVMTIAAACEDLEPNHIKHYGVGQCPWVADALADLVALAKAVEAVKCISGVRSNCWDKPGPRTAERCYLKDTEGSAGWCFWCAEEHDAMQHADRLVAQLERGGRGVD